MEAQKDYAVAEKEYGEPTGAPEQLTKTGKFCLVERCSLKVDTKNGQKDSRTKSPAVETNYTQTASTNIMLMSPGTGSSILELL